MYFKSWQALTYRLFLMHSFYFLSGSFRTVEHIQFSTTADRAPFFIMFHFFSNTKSPVVWLGLGDIYDVPGFPHRTRSNKRCCIHTNIWLSIYFVVLAEARKQSSVLFFIARRSLSTPLIDLIAYYAKSRNRTELHAQASVESRKISTCALTRER